ncbi:DUF2079 domain-containing protein [Catenuloplanes japonicus]|uniref:DUF2079 domain-containing protein n=1 Tax=Catenuloplanes japonicus TaxID=33876 RepID=UPI00068B5529|nr:DUF2079 domain-containing protein [Catenuloplanes japonicus]
MLVALYVYGRWARAQFLTFDAGACDLGIFHQAVQGWAYGGWPDVPIKGYPQLGDHFSPIFALLAPVLWIYDSAIVLVYAQVILICLSGVPIYHIFRRRYGIWVGAGMLTAYLATHAVTGTIMFPVHEVMFGAPLLAWGLERALAGKWNHATAIFMLLVTVKEDGGLFCAMLGLFALFNRRWRHGIFLMVWGVVWFVLTLKLIIPNVNPGGFTYAVDYQDSLHADGILEGIPYMITHPFEIIGILIDHPSKVETWMKLLLPVGFAALASPLVLLLVPVMMSRMLSSRDTQWASNLYYDMPLMPILFAAVADSIRRVGSLIDRFRGLGPTEDPARAPQKPAELETTEEREEVLVGAGVAGGGVPPRGSSAGDGGTADSAGDGAARDSAGDDGARGSAGDGGSRDSADGETRDAGGKPVTTPPRRQVRSGLILAAVAAVIFLGFAIQENQENWILKWHAGTVDFKNGSGMIDGAKQALSHVPEGVEVRATNNMLVPLLPTNTVTLIGSNVDKGDWAILDTVRPDCPIGQDDIPLVTKQLDRMGFREVWTDGRFIVLERTAEATTEIRGTGKAS